MLDATRMTIPVGDGKVPGLILRPADAAATVVLAHGAGAGMTHPWLVGLAGALHDLGVATVRFDFPYMATGRRFPDRPPAAIATWRAVTAAVASAGLPSPVWAAGKSYGGRMATMAVAEGMDAAGLVLLGYPLHAPGRPDEPRDQHLAALAGVPALFLQGRNDPFATPNSQLDEAVATIGPSAVLEWIADAGHSLEPRGTKRTAEAQAGVGALVAPRVAAFVRAQSPVVE